MVLHQPPNSRSLRVLEAITRPIDNTALTVYQTCPREYNFSMVQHRRGDGRSPALVFGSAWHKALEIHYKTNGDARAVMDGVIDSWEGHDYADDYRTLNRVMLDYEKYVAKYGIPSEEPAPTVGWPDEPLIEIASTISTEELVHPWTVRIDRFVDIDGLVYVEDHKTTSRLDKNYFKQFPLSQQMKGYTYAGQKLLPGRKVVGVRINLSHVLTGATEFHRQLVTFSPSEIEEWVENTNNWMTRLATDYTLPAGAAFPGHYGDNGCSRKFGMCGYHPVCSSSPRVRQAVLERDYPVKPWNPLEAADGE